MLRAAGSTVLFLWRAAAGYRLRPWRSPYLRWRVETFTGKPAGTLVAADFRRLLWSERRQMSRFAAWLDAMRHLRRGERP